jgi:hypothetical protein
MRPIGDGTDALEANTDVDRSPRVIAETSISVKTVGVEVQHVSRRDQALHICFEFLLNQSTTQFDFLFTEEDMVGQKKMHWTT